MHFTYLVIFTEPVWGYLKNKINAHRPTSLQDVWKWAQIEWKKIPMDYIRKLCYDKYMKRVKAVIEAKGEVTKY